MGNHRGLADFVVQSITDECKFNGSWKLLQANIIRAILSPGLSHKKMEYEDKKCEGEVLRLNLGDSESLKHDWLVAANSV